VIKVRKIDGEDYADDLRDMHLTCFTMNETMPDAADGQWWIAFDDDAPVGFAHLLQSKQYSNVGYLSRSGVLPTHRGNGLQKRFIRARITQARRNGWKWLRTDTRANPASSNSLISCGFRLFEPTNPWSFSDSLYFTLKL